MRSGRHRYGESLVLLKDTVAAGVKSITAETIAATRILMMYEIMAGNEFHGWISHAYGEFYCTEDMARDGYRRS